MCLHAECRILFVVMLSASILSVVMLKVVMLSVIVLGVCNVLHFSPQNKRNDCIEIVLYTHRQRGNAGHCMHHIILHRFDIS
jgi:hypothetical protein